MPSLLVTSALLDATLGVGVYLQATTVEADKLAGVSTQNVLLQTSGAPLVLTRDAYRSNPNWDLSDANGATGRFSAISISGIDAVSVNGDRAFSLYDISVPVDSDDPIETLQISPAGNDPFFDANGQVLTVNDATFPLLVEPGLTVYVTDTSTLGSSYDNAVMLSDVSFSVEGNSAANVLVANDAGSILSGLAGDDDLRGGAGDDVIYPGTGNDAIDGGPGNDTVVFAGPQSAYSVSYLADATQITELATGEKNNIVNAEIFEFDDGPLNSLFGSFSDADASPDSVVEGAAVDTPIGITAVISTADEGTVYSLVTTAAGSEEVVAGPFKIEPLTGVISVADGSLIDFELNQTEVIFVRATLSSGEFQVRRFDISVIGVDEPAQGLVSIIDLPREGGIARSSVTLSDPDGAIVDQRYQWQTADTDSLNTWTDLFGATSATLNVPDQQSYVGKMLRLEVTVTDEFGGVTELVSSISREILNTNDSPVGSVTIEGAAQEDQSLTASDNLSDEDGLGEFTYQWFADGVELSGATDTTYTLGALDVGRSLSVVISYTDGYGADERVESAATLPIANVNDAPVGDVLISGDPIEDETLSVTSTLSDEDGVGSFSYEWYAGNEVIPDATGPSLMLDQPQVGSAISVIISYTDGFGTYERVSSDQTALVANINDPPEGQITISGVAEEGQTLTALDSLADDDGLGEFNFQWRADDVDIEGATTNQLVLSAELIGRTLSVVITYVDAYGASERVVSEATEAVLNVNDPPTGSVDVIGLAEQGQVLTVENTLADEDGLGELSYQWLADGQAIQGAVGTMLQLDQALVGKRISVIISYTDSYGSQESVTSEPTVAGVANINDAPTGTVSIVGVAREDSSLSVQVQLADEDGLGDFQYQWLADGTPISNANDAGFSPTQVEVGKAITLSVSYTDGFGENESVTSLPTALVLNVNDEPTGTVVIEGLAREDDTLSVTNTLADEDGLGAISYQWLADAVPIAGAAGTSLLLEQGQVGREITVSASYTDGFGEIEQVVSLATKAVENVNDSPSGGVSVSGLLREDETLSVSTENLTDEDGLGSFTYQWLASGTPIPNATSVSLMLTQAQVDALIVARVSYVDGFGEAEQVDSSVSDPIENVNDEPTGTVSLEGTTFVGDTLAATNSLADEDGLGEVIYTWYADAEDVIFEGADSFQLTKETFGRQISVAASYFDAYGTLERVESQLSGVVGDDTPPVLTLIGESDLQIQLGTEFIDPGATALDDVAGDITADITVQGAVNSQEANAYSLTYTVKDQSDNSSSVTRLVTVVQTDRDGDGVADDEDAFPDDPTETQDSDGDGVGDNADAFPLDPDETADFDGDATGDNQDFDDDNDGYIDPTSPRPALLDAGTETVCGTDAEGFWCDVTNPSITSIDIRLNHDEWRLDELAVGTDSYCLLSDGDVFCGGWSGALNDSITPIPNEYGMTNLTAYSDHFCAMHEGDALCWGNTDVSRISGVLQVAAGDNFTCALMEQGVQVSCVSTTGELLSTHYTDNPVDIKAGNNLVCVKGRYGGDEAINCWAPSGWDSPRRAYFNGINSFDVGSEVCVAHEAGTTCLSYDRESGSSGPTTDFDFIADDVAAGEDFACAAVENNLECWGPQANQFNLQGQRVESVKLPPIDQFPFDATEWFDNDADGIGDNADTDDDNDGYLDEEDVFPLDANEWLDTDEDGVGDNADAFPTNPLETKDSDEDGVGDNEDAFPLDANEVSDSDQDGTGDNADEDDDNDGIEDLFDKFPLDSTEWLDTDGDGIGNFADTDNETGFCNSGFCVTSPMANAHYYLIDEVSREAPMEFVWPELSLEGLSYQRGFVFELETSTGESITYNDQSLLDPNLLPGLMMRSGGRIRYRVSDDAEGWGDRNVTHIIRPGSYFEVPPQLIFQESDIRLSADLTVTDLTFESTAAIMNRTVSDNCSPFDFAGLDPLLYVGSNLMAFFSLESYLPAGEHPLTSRRDNKFDFCASTPAGVYDYDFYVLDGLGGKVLYSLTVYVLEERLPESKIIWNPASTNDVDGDGVPNDEDLYPLDSLEQRDSDGDGIGDNADEDDDNDGFSDSEELAEGSDPLDAASIPSPVVGGLSLPLIHAVLQSRNNP